jgi:hypothetical protein
MFSGFLVMMAWDSFQIGRVAVKIINKQARSCSPAWRLNERLETPHHKSQHVTKLLLEPQMWWVVMNTVLNFRFHKR